MATAKKLILEYNRLRERLTPEGTEAKNEDEQDTETNIASLKAIQAAYEAAANRLEEAKDTQTATAETEQQGPTLQDIKEQLKQVKLQIIVENCDTSYAAARNETTQKRKEHDNYTGGKGQHINQRFYYTPAETRDENQEYKRHNERLSQLDQNVSEAQKKETLQNLLYSISLATGSPDSYNDELTNIKKYWGKLASNEENKRRVTTEVQALLDKIRAVDERYGDAATKIYTTALQQLNQPQAAEDEQKDRAPKPSPEEDFIVYTDNQEPAPLPADADAFVVDYTAQPAPSAAVGNNGNPGATGNGASTVASAAAAATPEYNAIKGLKAQAAALASQCTQAHAINDSSASAEQKGLAFLFAPTHNSSDLFKIDASKIVIEENKIEVPFVNTNHRNRPAGKMEVKETTTGKQNSLSVQFKETGNANESLDTNSRIQIGLCAVAAGLLSDKEYDTKTRKAIGQQAFPEITRIPTSWLKHYANQSPAPDFDAVRQQLLGFVKQMGFSETPNPFTSEALAKAQQQFTKMQTDVAAATLARNNGSAASAAARGGAPNWVTAKADGTPPNQNPDATRQPPAAAASSATPALNS